MWTGSCPGISLLLLVGAANLVACGSGDSPRAPPSPASPLLLAPPSPSPAPTSASPYWLASEAGQPIQPSFSTAAGPFNIASAHLAIVDPASPMTPVTLELPGQWQSIAKIEEGTIDSAAATIANLHARFVVYWKVSDGRLRRIDLRRGAIWPPASVAVSSLTANQVCRTNVLVLQDRETPERSWLFLSEPGPDRSCGTPDDRMLAVRLDMSESHVPVFVSSRTVPAAQRSDTGAITGFVIQEGNVVRRVDASFANPVDLFTVAADGIEFIVPSSDASAAHLARLWFREGKQIRSYDLVAGGDPVTLLTLDADECCLDSLSDANHLYFLVRAPASGGQLRLIRIDGPNSFDVLATEAPIHSFHVAQLTPTRVVYAYVDSTLRLVYRSIPKAGGTSTTISPAMSCDGGSRMLVAGENVWYDCAAQPDEWSDPFAGVVRSDATQAQRFDNSQIIGAWKANPAPLNSDTSANHALTIAHNVQNLDDESSLATLRTYDAVSRTALVNYGFVPVNRHMSLPDAQWTRPVLLTSSGRSFQGRFGQDLYFLQSSAPGLTQITAFVP